MIVRVIVLYWFSVTLLANTSVAQLSAPGDFGDYAVGLKKATRSEDPTLNDELYLWYPVDRQDAVGALQSQYTIDGLQFPSEHAFDNVPVAAGAILPVVVYFHGSGGWAAMQPTLAETLASQGFIVAGMTQNFSSKNMLNLLEDVSTRPDHPLFGRIDTNNAGLVGVSLGADYALAGELDERVKAVMPISASGTSTRSTKPMFFLTGSFDTGWVGTVNAFAHRRGGDRYLASINDAGHLSFADWCNRIAYADEHYGPESIPNFREFASQACTVRHIPNEDAVDLTNFYAAAFFGKYLQGEGANDEVLTTEYASTTALPLDFEAVMAEDRVGDANRDGAFNSADLAQAFQYDLYGKNRAATWRSGDWTFDARFTSGDLVRAFQEGWYEAPANGVAIVPEPSGEIAMAIGIATVFASSIRRRG